MGGKIHFRIAKDLKKKIRKAKHILFFLDYDGTLVAIRKRPHLAGISQDGRQLLKVLSKKGWSRVFIVTGRTLKNIKHLINLNSISYIGNHGFELEDRSLRYFNKKAEKSRRAISHIYKKLKKSLNTEGVIIENKFYTLSIHYRLVKKRYLDALKNKLYSIAYPYKKKGIILVTKGKKIFEIRPNVKWNKGTMVGWIVKKLKIRNALPVYIGDDKTDEDAFKALGNKGLTFLVSKKRIPTSAKFRFKTTGNVFNFLKDVIYLKDVK